MKLDFKNYIYIYIYILYFLVFNVFFFSNFFIYGFSTSKSTWQDQHKPV